MQTRVSAPIGSVAKAKRKVGLTYARHIVLTPGVRGGKPRIAGRRITVADIATWHLQQNRSVNEIAQEFDLTPAQIHAALTYYYDHQTDIDRQEAADFAAAEALQQQYPSKLQAKLHKRG